MSIIQQIEADVALIVKDIDGWWTGLKALETAIGTTLTSEAFTALLTTFNVAQATINDIAIYVGFANQAVTITQNVLDVVNAHVQSVSDVTTPTAS